MAREFALAGVDPEELKPSSQPEPPKTFWEKVRHFWNYYRWPVLITVAVIAVLFVCVGQILSRESSDYTVILATKQAWTDYQKQQLETLLAAHGEDTNGDGKVVVHVENVFVGSDNSRLVTASEQLTTYLYAGRYYLYAFVPDLYDMFILDNLNEGVTFAEPLSVTADGMAQDGSYWNWKGSTVQQDPIFATLDEDLYFMVRDTAEETVRQPQCKALLEAFISNPCYPACG